MHIWSEIEHHITHKSVNGDSSKEESEIWNEIKKRFGRL